MQGRGGLMDNTLYKLMNWSKMEEIIYSECDNPHEILGPTRIGNQMLMQALFPGAEEVFVTWGIKEKVAMEIADEEGYFAALLPDSVLPDY